MEKIVYALWRDPNDPREAFNARVRRELAPRLADQARALRINIQDEAVLAGTSPRIVSTRPQMEAVLQLWVDSARDVIRAPIDEAIGQAAGRFSAWLVCESTAIANTLHPPKPGERTEGFSQFVFLGRPPRLTWEAWREIWQRDHTVVGIETQSNFEYVQNLVVRPLTYAAPDYAAMIEECFPPAAMNDEAVYYEGVGAPDKLAENQRLMMESCARFIDFDRIDCIPTSQYEIKRLGE
jgi:hypothetical protein